MTGKLLSVNPQSLRIAAEAIREGKLVVFPTETVYGLGANALDGKAAARIFEAKGRPQFNPLIVHVPDEKAAAALVEMSAAARKVVSQFWPGPLTLILPRRKACPVSELCSAGLPTLAVRAPRHPAAQALLKEFGVPVAAPSANRSGEISPTTPAHVNESLGDAVDFILASGPCEVGLESTVLDLSGGDPVILRPGAVTAEEIEAVLEQPVAYEPEATKTPKSPGQLLRHYAPGVPVRLDAIDLEPGEALLAFGSDKFMGIKNGGAARDLPDTARRNLSESGDFHEAAANLFRMLHDLDRPEHKGIAVMHIPDRGLGVAINNRLRRAAEGSRKQ